MGKLISPTRIRTAQQCIRKWALKELYKYPTPVGEALIFGTRYHAAVEKWIKRGELPPDGPIYDLLLAAIRSGLLPEPYAVDVLVEHPVELDGISGTLDLLWGKLLIDHKTTAGEYYIPYPGDMIEELQANFYGLACMRQFDLSKLNCRWLYMTKDTPRCIPVEFELERNRSQDLWDATLPIRESMSALVDSKPENPLELKGALDRDYCNAFGGCPYKQICEKEKKTMSSPMKNLLKKHAEEQKKEEQKKEEPKDEPKKRGRPKKEKTDINPPKIEQSVEKVEAPPSQVQPAETVHRVVVGVDTETKELLRNLLKAIGA